MSEPRTKPRWKWWIATGLAICLIAAGLRVGLPLYRRSVALARLDSLGFVFGMTSHRPQWVSHYDRRDWTIGLESVREMYDFRYTADSQNHRPRSETVALLQKMREFGELENLELVGAAIEDADLAVLNHFPNLEVLNLESTSIKGDGLRYLGGLSNLRHLILTGTQIDDASLTHLAQLMKLESLWIDRTRISNAGLKHLARLPNLRELSVSNTAVTDAGLDELLKTHPALSVSDD